MTSLLTRKKLTLEEIIQQLERKPIKKQHKTKTYKKKRLDPAALDWLQKKSSFSSISQGNHPLFRRRFSHGSRLYSVEFIPQVEGETLSQTAPSTRLTFRRRVEEYEFQLVD